MVKSRKRALQIVLLLGVLTSPFRLLAQDPETLPIPEEILPVPSMEEISKRWGPNDTVVVPAIWYRNEVVNYKEMPMAWISKLPPKELAQFIEEWTRLHV